VVLRPKKLKIREKNVKTVWAGKKNQILCHEIEPNTSKDRSMHEGDNPSFWVHGGCGKEGDAMH
jgi:hypothetical protein